MSEKLYVYSLDKSDFRAQADGGGWETREQALAAGREQAAVIHRLKATSEKEAAQTKPGPVWTGVKVGYTADAFFPTAEHIVEFMGEQAEGEVDGEALDGWPDVASPSAECEEGTAERELFDFVEQTLHPFLSEWTKRHNLQPTFWSVTDVVKHADDDDALAKT